jgi:3-deoxy-manno-octulosonate cytidylyltransferase (CMP-KDO synthetase)
MKTAIIIPARYGSTRFPGKPLVQIGGKTMLSYVVDIARDAAKNRPETHVAVATEDQRIADHCASLGVECVMTSDDCATGSDRVLQASEKLGGDFDFILGLQGDAPFTPPSALRALMDAFAKDQSLSVITPVINLRWEELDDLREAKKITPFSGTTCVIDSTGRALWFSKNILPAIRKEKDLRAQSAFSPIHQHLGLYGFRAAILKSFVTLPQGYYEQLEGLEQLRLIEHGIPIQTVTLSLDLGLAQAGIDSPEDVVRAERLLKKIS